MLRITGVKPQPAQQHEKEKTIRALKKIRCERKYFLEVGNMILNLRRVGGEDEDLGNQMEERMQNTKQK